MQILGQVSCGCAYTQLWHPDVHLLQVKGLWSDSVASGEMGPTRCKAEHTCTSQLISEREYLVKAKVFHEEERNQDFALIASAS